jgi:hypothetical protein
MKWLTPGKSPNRHLPGGLREGFQLTALALAKDLTRVMAALSLKTVKKKIIFGTCLLFLLAAGYFANYGVRTTRPETLRGLVEQNVKIGASPEAVIKFLDEQHLEHGPIRRTSEYSDLRTAYGDAPMIGAIKRRTWRTLLMFESIQIVFIFDENNHLARFDLHPVYTGP